MFWYFKHEMLNTHIWNYLEKWKDTLKCKTKSASRWHQVTVKWVIAIEPNHLNGWFIQERNTVMLLRDMKQRYGCLEWFLLAKSAIMVSKT